MTRRSVILGTGSALPRQAVTNDDLARKVDTSDEWIVARTGIKVRHIAEPDETTATLAADAARVALARDRLETGPYLRHEALTRAEAATGTHAKSLRDFDGNPECGPFAVGCADPPVMRTACLRHDGPASQANRRFAPGV